MSIDWPNFTPWAALGGGLLIGLASLLLLFGTGRIAGIAGILGAAFNAMVGDRQARSGQAVRWAFIAGLVLSPWLWSLFGKPPVGEPDIGFGLLLLAGLLVGFGVRLGNGCTSGHGICGLSRLSLRSLVNVLCFMGAGFATVALLRHALQQQAMGALIAMAAGLLFGLGLLLSGMADPLKVKGFLDLLGPWNPTLALVMGSALALGVVGFRLASARRTAWNGEAMQLPPPAPVDGRLALGGLIFGVGWGLAGYCPGPAIVAAGSGSLTALAFVAAMVAGMLLHDRIFATSRPSAPSSLAPQGDG